MIYYLQAVDAIGLIKIGCSDDLGDRLSHLRGSSPVGLNLLATETGGRYEENMLHLKFSELKDHGEWFRPGKILIDHIDSVVMMSYKRKPSKIRGNCMKIGVKHLREISSDQLKMDRLRYHLKEWSQCNEALLVKQKEICLGNFWTDIRKWIKETCNGYDLSVEEGKINLRDSNGEYDKKSLNRCRAYTLLMDLTDEFKMRKKGSARGSAAVSTAQPAGPLVKLTEFGKTVVVNAPVDSSLEKLTKEKEDAIRAEFKRKREEASRQLMVEEESKLQEVKKVAAAFAALSV
jgi:hypothetical protein